MSRSSKTPPTTTTPAPTVITISGAVREFFDEATAANTVIGSGQTHIKVFLEPSAAIPVVYYTNGGSGTVMAASAGDSLFITGQKWSVTGSGLGAESINSAANNATISISGSGNAQGSWQNSADTTASNTVGLSAGNAFVFSNGSKDLIESSGGKDTVEASNSAEVEVNGGSVTVVANGIGPVVAFFNNGGGALRFINNSTVSATVSGVVSGGKSGSATAFGGVGGGVYIGGLSGNNSLVGGSGAVTLVGAGSNNYLEAAAYSSAYFNQNILNAGNNGGSAVLLADSTTGYNEFIGGTGNSTITSFGSGKQTYYVGASGTECITGSTVSGATNEYIFNQDSTGSGQDTIANFRLGTDHIDVNYNGSLTGVTIKGFTSLSGGVTGTVVSLSDNAKIYLVGITGSTLSTSIIGGTHI
jgi:hypothetical protein